MRFVISTYFSTQNYNIFSQRLEIKTNELQKAFEACRAFVIGSNSCKIDIWENNNKTKTPSYKALLSIRDATQDKGILTHEIIFNNWVLNFREKVKNFSKELEHALKGVKNV